MPQIDPANFYGTVSIVFFVYITFYLFMLSDDLFVATKLISIENRRRKVFIQLKPIHRYIFFNMLKVV